MKTLWGYLRGAVRYWGWVLFAPEKAERDIERAYDEQMDLRAELHKFRSGPAHKGDR